MGMTSGQQNAVNGIGAAVGNEQDAIVAYNNAKATLAGAQSTFDQCKTNLDACVIAKRTADGALESAIQLPVGYTPPA
jgi:hypothetical protein